MTKVQNSRNTVYGIIILKLLVTFTIKYISSHISNITKVSCLLQKMSILIVHSPILGLRQADLQGVLGLFSGLCFDDMAFLTPPLTYTISAKLGHR